MNTHYTCPLVAHVDVRLYTKQRCSLTACVQGWDVYRIYSNKRRPRTSTALNLWREKLNKRRGAYLSKYGTQKVIALLLLVATTATTFVLCSYRTQQMEEVCKLFQALEKCAFKFVRVADLLTHCAEISILLYLHICSSSR